jgi:hypothetical protein
VTTPFPTPNTSRAPKAVADDVPPRLEVVVPPPQRLEDLPYCRLVRRLRVGEAGAVDARVDGGVDVADGGVDFRSLRRRVEVAVSTTHPLELGGEHPRDVRRLLVDDGVPLAVVEDRDRHPTGVDRVRAPEHLVQRPEAVRRLRRTAVLLGRELPPAVPTPRVDDVGGDGLLQAEQSADERRASRRGPRAMPASASY